MNHCSTRPARVCNLCYMLIVAEHEVENNKFIELLIIFFLSQLIEIEQQFARTQNVPIKDAIIRVPMDIAPKHRPALLPSDLY